MLTLRQLQRTAALVFPEEVLNNGEMKESSTFVIPDRRSVDFIRRSHRRSYPSVSCVDFICRSHVSVYAVEESTWRVL